MASDPERIALIASAPASKCRRCGETKPAAQMFTRKRTACGVVSLQVFSYCLDCNTSEGRSEDPDDDDELYRKLEELRALMRQRNDLRFAMSRSPSLRPDAVAALQAIDKGIARARVALGLSPRIADDGGDEGAPVDALARTEAHYVCKRCEKRLPLSAFYVRERGRKRSGACKACGAAQKRGERR